MASVTVAFNAIVVEALNEHNYRYWSSQIESYLLAEDVWDVVKEEAPESKQGKAELFKDWRRKDAKALHAIKVCCGKEAFSLIWESSTAKIAWEVLEKKFNLSSCGSTTIPERKGRDEEEDIVLLATTNDSGQILDQGEELVAGEDLESQVIAGGNENGDILNRFFSYVKDGNLDKTMELLGEPPYPLLSARDPESDTGNTALHIAVAKGYSGIVKELVRKMGDQGLTALNKRGETALHTAAMQKANDIVEFITDKMEEKDLEIRDKEGYTAFGRLISQWNDKREWQNIQSLIGKNRKLLTIESPKNHIPIVEAAACRRWKLCSYLYDSYGNNGLINTNQGAELLNMCIRHPKKGLDIARNLLRSDPRMVFVKNKFGYTPLSVLARLHFAFLSGSRLTYWQKWVYNGMYVQQQLQEDLVMYVQQLLAMEVDICSVIKVVLRLLFTFFLMLLGYYHLYAMKVSHLKVLDCMELVTSRIKREELTPDEQSVVTDSVLKAIENGHVEYVTHMCTAYPQLLDTTNIGKERRDIFEHTIACRQGEIYDFIYRLKPHIGGDVADFDNNMLHVAAKYSSLTRSSQDASLQMQRELQWFKVVESIVPFETLTYVNREGLTARELFTDSHVELKKEAEKAIKGIATACTTVGALIVTIMFAVAFTVPGGTNSNTGLPMFLHEKLFRIFILSDTISLISSTTSVITFLGLLTSTYAEDDFLRSLPKKMMIGLSTLFISIAAMMITFYCALTIMLDGEAKLIIPVIVFATVPVVSFAYILFPLLYEIWTCTYRNQRTGKKVFSVFFTIIARCKLKFIEFCIRHCPDSCYRVSRRLDDMIPTLEKQAYLDSDNEDVILFR